MAYTATTWNTGDLITAEKLNHLEQGVAAASAATAAATTETAGVVKQIANIAQLSGEPTQSDFNDLLTALQTAGIMAPPAG